MLVRCTKKTLDLLGRSITLTELAPTDDDWYLDLLWIDRQKCLLLTHAATLFSIFRPRVRVAELRPVGPYLTEAIETELCAEGLPSDTFAELAPDAWRLAKTASRSTLGHMTQMAFEIQHIIAQAGGLDHADIADINHWLRHSLRRRDGGYTYSIDLIAERLATRP
jgi:hypothetical protein